MPGRYRPALYGCRQPAPAGSRKPKPALVLGLVLTACVSAPVPVPPIRPGYAPAYPPLENVVYWSVKPLGVSHTDDRSTPRPVRVRQQNAPWYDTPSLVRPGSAADRGADGGPLGGDQMTRADRTLFTELLLAEQQSLQRLIETWTHDRRPDAVAYTQGKQQRLEQITAALDRLEQRNHKNDR